MSRRFTDSKTLNAFATIETDKTTSVSKTYEAACQFDLDGNILQTVDIYQDDDAGELTYTNQEKVLVIVKNRCLEKFYETCRDGHEPGIQNPFLTWHAFKVTRPCIRCMAIKSG